MNQKQQLDLLKITEALNKKEASINNADKARFQAETKRDTLRTQLEGLNNELRALDVNPAQSEMHVEELEAKILKEMSDLESLIPEGF